MDVGLAQLAIDGNAVSDIHTEREKMRSSKTIGLWGVALLALLAFAGTSSAPAAELEFKAESFPATLQGTGSQIFKFKAGTITCPTSSQKGEAKSPAVWWSMKLADSGCTLGEKKAAATVESGECELRYYTYSGLYIVCKSGVLKIVSGECVIEIKPQELESVSFGATGTGSTRAIFAKVNIGEMAYTQSKACTGGAGAFTEGAVTGEEVLKGSNGKGEQQGIFIA